MYEAGKEILQSGVIARRQKRGKFEVALVTSSSGTHWVIPKGHWERNLSMEESAAQEAYEEAGLVGTIGPPLGTYFYSKRGYRYRVFVFALEVSRELSDWPEAKLRQRAWLSPAEAAERVNQAGLRRLLLELTP